MKIIITENEFVDYVKRRYNQIKLLMVVNMAYFNPCEYDDEEFGIYDYYVDVKNAAMEELSAMHNLDIENRTGESEKFYDRVEGQIFDYFFDMVKTHYEKTLEKGC